MTVSNFFFWALTLSTFLIGECSRKEIRHQQDQQRDEFDHRFRRRYNKMPTVTNVQERFRFFDEYLLSIRQSESAAPKIRLPEPNEYFEGEVTTSTETGPTLSETERGDDDVNDDGDRQKVTETMILDRIRKDRTSPKFACCALGQLAGNHGFHCHAKFYENRIQMRNRNRAQTRQAALEDIEREPDYNEHLWHTFGNCVRKHAKSFHHCCYAARVLGSESVDLHNYELRRF